MQAPYRKSRPVKSRNTPSATSSPASEAGLSPCFSPVGRTTCPSGRVPAPASPSAPPAKVVDTLTSAICGLSSSSSSPSAALQSSLASRLQAALDVNGSPEYELTWKAWDMLSGPPICALRASARRTSGNGCTGWPTPMYLDHRMASTPRKDLGQKQLPNVAALAGWPTPTSTDFKGGYEGGRIRNWKLSTDRLDVAAQLAGWNTPRATDGSHGGPNQAGGALPADAALAGWPTPTKGNADGSQMAKEASATGKRPDGTKATVSLNQVANLAGWATPQASDNVEGKRTATDTPQKCLGRDVNTFLAGTENRGALNPAHSRWLMGFPPEWCDCAVTAMQSFPKSRRRSSKPS